MPIRATADDQSLPSSVAVSSTLAGEMHDFDNQQSAAEGAETRMSKEISRVAREQTSSTQSTIADSTFLSTDKALDPDSPEFNARLWAKNFYSTRKDALGGRSLKSAGLSFRNLNVHGFGPGTEYQSTVGNYALKALSKVRSLIWPRTDDRVDILRDLEGVVRPGETLAVLGPPGSGCSTLLRTIAGNTYGFHVDENSTLNYMGTDSKRMHSAFKGEAVYTAEVDDHFPHLTVGETLLFAARARTPHDLPPNLDISQYATHIRDVMMAVLGISHTKNTRVGDDYVRGVSGGERKRVTIAEAALGFAPLQCWDNSTRGLDSANAIEFCRTLRTQADVLGITSCVAIYQAPQSAYDLFHKVILLYEGRQIFFGDTQDAKAYFENLGFHCPEQQTTADFLTSMTSHSERIVKPGWKGETPPRSPDEFAKAWKKSSHRRQLMVALEEYDRDFPIGGTQSKEFAAACAADKSTKQRNSSPFMLSYVDQIKLNLWRSFLLFKSDPWMTITMLLTNLFETLVLSSIFYNLTSDSSSMDRRSLVLFFSILINAMGNVLEILTLYAKRRIVEKHFRYALYHPSAEAISAMIMDLPYKVVNSMLINVTLYFMTNLRREPGAFFMYFLVSFTTTMTMSMLFRFIGSVTQTAAQAFAPSSIILLGLALYTGYAIPPVNLQGWIGWLRWINPLFYGLETLMVNEFVGRGFPCDHRIPSGPGYSSALSKESVCNVPGSVAGEQLVEGADFIRVSYSFLPQNRWRNFGIIIAMTVAILFAHLLASEWVSAEKTKGEILVFTASTKKDKRSHPATDIEDAGNYETQRQQIADYGQESAIENHNSVFHWKDVSYEVKVKGKTRRILDNVDGWVKPGTLTALMGVSGAGKTTLLDVLASRVTMGVITGEMLVDGSPRDSSFQRKTGYVQQQDLHLSTSTVREALQFSALLRQPAQYSRKEKIAYVDTVIGILGMEEYSDAIIGIAGEGLNVEQRKRLTIGVELAARPDLLIFLDEPTSGLDSQTSWSICNLMEKLTKSGQAVLCTIHQPSAMLFQRFDRLLLLAKGGRTVYFGDIGRNSTVLIEYFTRNGAPPLEPGSNPAEYMLEVIGAVPGGQSQTDWPAIWRRSPEYQKVQDELSRLSSAKNGTGKVSTMTREGHGEFANDFSAQLWEVTKRTVLQYWRSPQYILSKAVLTIGSAFFIGLSFLNVENTSSSLQNQLLGIFLFLFIFGQLTSQIMPVFVIQRTLYEARERPSKTYAWPAFIFANITVEVAWNSVMSVFCFFVWYYPIGFYQNAAWTNATHARGIAMFLHVWAFFMTTSTFAHMMIAGLHSAEVAGGIVNLIVVMLYTFCGVLSGPVELPGFWIFMYYLNPFTYTIEGIIGTSLANSPVTCSPNELFNFLAPSNSTCIEYMASYIQEAGGYLAGSDLDTCHYCKVANTNEFLSSVNIKFANRWRNLGIMSAFITFNIGAAAMLYWLFRVPRKVVKKNP